MQETELESCARLVEQLDDVRSRSGRKEAECLKTDVDNYISTKVPMRLTAA